MQILLTCEHGGNTIPAPYKKLFIPHKSLVSSHCGFDPGALEMARHISKITKYALIYSQTSRLLIELNRSVTNRTLFSNISAGLSDEQKIKLIKTIYLPYHNSVIQTIRKQIKSHDRVFHFSIHSFTPQLDDEVRNADIGLLYDPSRMHEVKICNSIKKLLLSECSSLKVRKNYPYRGTSDGLTTILRKKFSQDHYCGIEIEINQKHFLGKSEIWKFLWKRLPSTLIQVATDSYFF